MWTCLTLLDPYIMPKQAIKFSCRYVLRRPNRMTKKKLLILGLAIFEILWCFIVSSTETRHKEECHSKMYGVPESSHHSLKECKLLCRSVMSALNRGTEPKTVGLQKETHPRANGCSLLWKAVTRCDEDSTLHMRGFRELYIKSKHVMMFYVDMSRVGRTVGLTGKLLGLDGCEGVENWNCSNFLLLWVPCVI